MGKAVNTVMKAVRIKEKVPKAELKAAKEKAKATARVVKVVKVVRRAANLQNSARTEEKKEATKKEVTKKEAMTVKSMVDMRVKAEKVKERAKATARVVKVVKVVRR